MSKLFRVINKLFTVETLLLWVSFGFVLLSMALYPLWKYPNMWVIPLMYAGLALTLEIITLLLNKRSIYHNEQQ